MALIVGVNTYASAIEFSAYADARGVSIAGDSDVLLTIAMDYLATLEDSWQGSRTSAVQPLAWPRTGVYVYGTALADDAIPQSLKDAQMRLAMESDAGVNLMPSIGVSSKGSVIEETVDVVTVKYAEGINNTQPIFTAVTGLLKPLLRTAGGGSNFAVTRV
jgi:hypothetical protein